MSSTTVRPPASNLSLVTAFSGVSNDLLNRSGLTPRRLLLIDDEPDICFLVQSALGEFEGWHVATCSDPDTFVFAGTPPWDVILLEVSMTRLAGFALVPALRTNPATSHIPIVLLTSQLMPRDYARFRQMAVDGVIAKPFDPLTLGRQIAALLGWPAAAKATH